MPSDCSSPLSPLQRRFSLRKRELLNSATPIKEAEEPDSAQIREEAADRNIKIEISEQAKCVKDVDNRYLDSLMFKTEKANFLQKNVKEIFKPKNAEDKTDKNIEFAK